MAVDRHLRLGLAHEVRNPLNSIALQLSILERRVAPLPAGVAGEIKELVGVIREEVERLDNLVGRLPAVLAPATACSTARPASTRSSTR